MLFVSSAPVVSKHWHIPFHELGSSDLFLWHPTHTHTRLTALFLGLPGWAGTRKVKPIWILLKQETVSGSCISWAICKSTPRSRQITTPAPNHSVFLQAGCPSYTYKKHRTETTKQLKTLIKIKMLVHSAHKREWFSRLAFSSNVSHLTLCNASVICGGQLGCVRKPVYSKWFRRGQHRRCRLFTIIPTAS